MRGSILGWPGLHLNYTEQRGTHQALSSGLALMVGSKFLFKKLVSSLVEILGNKWQMDGYAWGIGRGGEKRETYFEQILNE